MAVFALPAIAGVDPAAAAIRMRFDEATPDPVELAAVRAELGLDDAWILRYLRFLRGVVEGDLGRSFSSRRPVAPDALTAFGVSLSLTALALALALVGAVALALTATVHRHGVVDRAVTGLSALASAVPEHVLGPLAVLVCAVWLDVLPAGGWNSARDLVLPTLVLAFHPALLLVQVLRSELDDALGAAFVRTARAKGVGRRRLVTRHAFAVARQGLVAMTGVMGAGLVGSAVVVEATFSVPGIGRYLLDAVRSADLPAIQGGLLLTVGFALVVGAVADTAARLLDPRVRREAR